MKRIQPYYFLIALAALYVIAGVILYSIRGLTLLKHGEPIEPQTVNEKGDLFELWFTGADLLDLSVDRNVTGIFFGTGSKKVTLLDRDRRIRWEKNFPAAPLQTKISACGSYLAVGTEGGDLFFMSTDQQRWWQQEVGEPIYLVTLSAGGRWVLIARGDPEQKTHHLELYDGFGGEMRWSIAVGGPVQRIYLAGEDPELGQLFFSYEHDGIAITAAATLTGVRIWEKENVSLAAVTRTESRLALIGDTTLIVCGAQGNMLWERPLPAGFTTSAAMFHPQSCNLLLYGSGDGLNENLYYLNAEGKILWQKKIADGALLSFTADGNGIIASSWRHFKEDFSQMVFLDGSGEILPSSLELGMRVERLLVSSSRRYIVIAGEDGYIDVIDLDGELSQENASPPASSPLYSPVITGLEKDQLAATLYFNDDDLLIPVSRIISQTDNPLRAAIEELIRGPSRESGLNRIIPKDAGIAVAFEGESGQLYLDISPEFAGIAGSFQTNNALESLRYTVGLFPEVKKIYLTLDKEPLETFGDGMILEQPLKPHRWKNPLYIPLRVSERYYMAPMEARDLEIEGKDLRKLLGAVIKQCRIFYFVPGGLELIDVKENGAGVEINLNSSFRLLFPEGGGTEEQLQAAMVLDALFLTAVENSGSRRVKIYVEGEDWSPPDGYPLLNCEINKPYYINPEF